MSPRDPLGSAVTALWVAGHFAAVTFLGITVFAHTGSAASTAAEPDTSLTKSDPLPELGNT